MKKYIDTEIKKIIEEVVGNNDTTLNNTKLLIFHLKQILTVAKLINYEPKKAFVDPLMQGLLLTI